MKIGAIALMTIATVFMFGTAWQAMAQDAKAPHPSMAPVEQYLMEDRNSEIALARVACSISRRKAQDWNSDNQKLPVSTH